MLTGAWPACLAACTCPRPSSARHRITVIARRLRIARRSCAAPRTAPALACLQPCCAYVRAYPHKARVTACCNPIQALPVYRRLQIRGIFAAFRALSYPIIDLSVLVKVAGYPELDHFDPAHVIQGCTGLAEYAATPRHRLAGRGRACCCRSTSSPDRACRGWRPKRPNYLACPMCMVASTAQSTPGVRVRDCCQMRVTQAHWFTPGAQVSTSWAHTARCQQALQYQAHETYRPG